MSWELIDTAPKGYLKSYGMGPRIIGWSRFGGTYIVAFCRHADGVKGTWKNDANRNEKPTHWQPLPAPPIDTAP